MVTGKGGKTQPIPIHPEVAKLAERMPEFGYWFTSPASSERCVHPTAVSGTITAALKSCGTTATAHQLRDTAATRLQRTVKDIRITQAMLRHSNITSTMKYTLASNEELKRAVQAMDWADQAQSQGVDVSTMSTGQLNALAEQLAAVMANRDDGVRQSAVLGAGL